MATRSADNMEQGIISEAFWNRMVSIMLVCGEQRINNGKVVPAYLSFYIGPELQIRDSIITHLEVVWISCLLFVIS